MVCYNYTRSLPLAIFRSGDLTIAGSLAGNYLFIRLGIKLGIFPTDVTSRAHENFKFIWKERFGNRLGNLIGQ